MRQCFPSSSSPSDGVYQAWGWGRGSDLQRIRICSLFSYWLGGIPLGEKKLSEEEKSIWSLEKLHGSSLLPIPSHCSCSCCSDARTANLDRQAPLPPPQPVPLGLHCAICALAWATHTAPKVHKNTYYRCVQFVQEKVCLCLPPASLSYLRAFCFFRDYMRN